MKRPTAIHSGDVGDLIYALPVVREIANRSADRQADLILGMKQPVRKAFDAKWSANVIPLLEIQPYLNSVWRQKPGDKWTHDLDPFRGLIFNKHVKGKNITAYVCDVARVDYVCGQSKWIKVDQPVYIPDKPVVINRTARYNNPLFPWVKIIQKYGPFAVFIGTDKEHSRFCDSFGDIPYCPTENLLDVARLIAGSLLFIGNQSVSYAIAEGLKQNVIQESYPQIPDCMFPRTNAWHGFRGDVPMPNLNRLKTVELL